MPETDNIRPLNQNLESLSLDIELMDHLSQLLKQTLGSSVELTGYTVAKRQPDELVLLVQLHRPTAKIVVKLAGPRSPLIPAFERAATIHRLVRQYTAIPVADILAVDTSCQTWPWPYLIKTYLPGDEWATVRPRLNPAELAEAYTQLGHAVAQLHAIRFPLFGELSGQPIQGAQVYLTALIERAQSAIKPPRWRDLFLSLLQANAPLFSQVEQANLCHDDLHKHNLLFQHRSGRWQLAAILDFDKAWAGHAETDLARLEFWRGLIGPTFWSAYTSIHAVDPLYQHRQPIYQLLWCLEYARPTPQHLADTQKLCCQLGLPRLEQFD
jgi:aminoglycoside phosphotransferase (APT) family kinase protein